MSRRPVAAAATEPRALARQLPPTGGHAAQSASGKQGSLQQQPQEAQVADTWCDPAYPDQAPPSHDESVHLGAVMRKDLNNAWTGVQAIADAYGMSLERIVDIISTDDNVRFPVG